MMMMTMPHTFGSGFVVAVWLEELGTCIDEDWPAIPWAPRAW